MNKSRGSAIVIAMLLISAVGGIAFSFAKVVFLELVNASIYENGAVAYYAAESGMEEGFLRYRYDRNEMVPSTDWTLDDVDNKTFRSNLTTKQTKVGVPSYTGRPIADALDKVTPPVTWADYRKQQIFDLRMGYLGTEGKPIYGQEIAGAANAFNAIDIQNANYGTGDYQHLRVGQDESIKIDLTGLNLVGNSLVLYSKFIGTNFNDLGNRCKALMEVKFLVKETAATPVKEYKELLNYGPTACSTALGIDGNSLLGADTFQLLSATQFYYTKNDLRSIFTRAGMVNPPSSSVNISLYIKPLYYDAYIGLATGNCASNYNTCGDTKENVISGAYSKVESVGHFGGVSRSLIANIDRQSGTLYDLYDYVIYKAN